MIMKLKLPEEASHYDFIQTLCEALGEAEKEGVPLAERLFIMVAGMFYDIIGDEERSDTDKANDAKERLEFVLYHLAKEVPYCGDVAQIRSLMISMIEEQKE